MRSISWALTGFLLGAGLSALLFLSDTAAEPGEGQSVSTPHAIQEWRTARTPTPATWDPKSPPPVTGRSSPEALQPSLSAQAGPGSDVGVVVFGAVRDASGASIPDRATIAFKDGRSEARRAGVDDAAGYALTSMTPGEWSVSANLTGFLPYAETFTIPEDQPFVRHDVLLYQAVVLTIRAVTPAGDPLFASIEDSVGQEASWGMRLAAIATREAPGSALPPIAQRSYFGYGIGRFSDATQRMMFGELEQLASQPGALGTLELDSALPAYVSLLFRHIVLETQFVEAGATEVVFVVPVSRVTDQLGALTIEVVDADTRRPLADARATLTDSQASGHEIRPDSEGRFLWERQRPGLLGLLINAPGHERWVIEVDVPAGGTLDLGRLELETAVHIRGRLQDRQGAALQLNLSCYPVERYEQTRSILSRYRYFSETDGSFDITPIGRGRFEVEVRDRNYVDTSVVIDTTSGDVDGLVITVDKGTLLHLNTLWPSTQNYGVTVRSSGGAIVSEKPSWRGDWDWKQRLLPGVYQVDLVDQQQVLKTVTVTVGNEESFADLAP